MKFTCIWLHRDIGLESALVMDPALARPSASTEAEPKSKKKSLTNSLILPSRRSEIHLDPEGHWNGRQQRGVATYSGS